MTPAEKKLWLYNHEKELKDASTRIFELEKWISIPIPNTLDELRALNDDFAVTHSVALVQKMIDIEQRANEHKNAKAQAKLVTPGKGRKAAKVRKQQAKDIEEAQRSAEEDGDFDHLRYGPDERKKDRQRLVRVDDVLSAVLWWEQEMVVARIGSPMAAFLAPLRQVLAVCSFAANNWRTLLEAFRLILIEPGVWGSIFGLVMLLSMKSCADAKTFAKGLGSSLHIRELAAGRIRDAALPQRNQTRHRRTKRTRL